MTIKDTTALQLISLDSYMDSLGYERSAFSYGYEFKYPVKRGEKYISLRTAVNLYNCYWVYDNDLHVYAPLIYMNSMKEFGFPIKLNAYEYNKLSSRKIVQEVFLQCTKHQELITQKHKVKFVSEFYYDLFLGDAED